MKTIMVSLVLATMNPIAAYAAPLEFKGVVFGSTTAEFENVHKVFECVANPKDASITWCSVGPDICRAMRRRCGPYELDAANYAGEPASNITAVFLDGKLERLEVYFDPVSFDTIRGALAEKYGKPESSINKPIQSVAGGKSTNTTVMWSPDGATVLLVKYHERLTQSAVFLVSKTWSDSQARRDATATSARSKGM